MEITKYILAIVTTKGDQVSGGAPIFYGKDQKELEQIAGTLEAILDGIAHKLYEGMYIIVKHS